MADNLPDLLRSVPDFGPPRWVDIPKDDQDASNLPQKSLITKYWKISEATLRLEGDVVIPMVFQRSGDKQTKALNETVDKIAVGQDMRLMPFVQAMAKTLKRIGSLPRDHVVTNNTTADDLMRILGGSEREHKDPFAGRPFAINQPWMTTFLA
ncbi:Hypothetical protein D9617_24g016300 [Elsinoe fawcettii]|nr:Hypothetical protein D9617_24g016300 [Elsinoe fawcettii]